MPTFPCEIEGMSAVLVGSFNPAIFHPQWLARHGLVSEAEAEAANIEIVRPELSVFTVGLLRMVVEQVRLRVETTTAEASGPVRDLIIGAMHLLEQTPVSQMGINRAMHFKMPTEETWHAVIGP